MGMLESDRCYHFVFLHPYPFPGPPSALANLQLLENGMDKVKLLWSVTRDAYPATQLIFLWTLGGGADVGNATRNITEHSGEQTLDNLVPETAYNVSVYTVNAFGESEVARRLPFQTQALFLNVLPPGFFKEPGAPVSLNCSAYYDSGRWSLFWQYTRAANESFQTIVFEDSFDGVDLHNELNDNVLRVTVSFNMSAERQGLYRCVLANPTNQINGISKSTVQVLLQDYQTAPVINAVGSQDVTVDSITISWRMPQHSNVTINGYLLEVRPRNQANWTALPIEQHLFTIFSDMVPFTVYHFRVRADTSLGLSGYSETFAARTLPLDSEAPENVTISADPTSIILHWKLASRWTDQHGVLTRILVSYKRQTSGATGMLLQ
eukprot:scpid92299/ scgid0344/ 